MTLQKLFKKINDGGRIDEDEALRLFLEADLLEIGQLAQKRAGRLHAPGQATFLIDRNINYTNICTSRCRFCAFYRTADALDAYVLTPEQILEKVAEAVELGATQIMLQGGLNPGLGLLWFEDVVRRILRGGFPEPALRSSQSRREAWFASYVRTLLDRDVKDLAAIDEAVPAEVLTAALFARFRSRKQHPYAEKILSAMRDGFGGHKEPQQHPDPARQSAPEIVKPKAGRS